METFLVAMNEAWLDPDARRLATQALDYRMLGDIDADQRWALARKLYAILNRIELIDIKTLPDAGAIISDGGRERHRYFPDPANPEHARITSAVSLDALGIELTRQNDGRWLFSAETVGGIEKLDELTREFETVAGRDYVTSAEWIEAQMPESLKGEGNEALTLEYWQWLMLFILIVIGLMLDFVVRTVLKLVTIIALRRRGDKASEATIGRVMRPFGLMVAAIFWVITVHFIGLPELPESIAFVASRALAILAGTWAAWRVTDMISEILEGKAANTETKLDDIVIPLIRKAIKIFILAVGVIYGANSLNINIIPMLTGLGIGGLAFAFAARDTIENFFGSIAVILDRPFEVGDWVVIDDTEGIVETIGFRSTRIRTFYNSLVTVPNANLVRATVDNYGKRKYRRWKCHIGVQYDTTPDQLVAFTEGIRELVRCHPYTRKDYFQVWVNEFANSSINILLYIFHEVPDWSTELRERERLMLDIMRLADRLGVQFAFPTMTIHKFDETHHPYEQRHETPQQLTERRAMVSGIREAQSLVKDQPWQNDKPGPVQFKAGPSRIDDENQTFIEDRSAGGE